MGRLPWLSCRTHHSLAHSMPSGAVHPSRDRKTVTVALDPRFRGGDDVVVNHPQVSAFLGVERAVCGRRWRTRAADSGEAAALAERLGLPEIVARLLAQRGI